MLVLSVVFVSAVAALCSAQNNTIDISSTFTATGEVEWHVAEETLVGTFTIARDAKALRGVEEVYYKDRNDIEKVIQRYDNKTSFYVRGPSNNPSCYNQTRNGTLSEFWEWTSNAAYDGQRKIREKNFDVYSYATGDVRLEVIMDPGDDKRPYYFNRKSAEAFVQFSFQEFSTATPDAKLFVVPESCPK